MTLQRLFELWYTPFSMFHYAIGILTMYIGLPWYSLIIGYALREIFLYSDNLITERIMNYVMATFGFYVSYISYKYGWFQYIGMIRESFMKI
jgi:hypothetical protein